MAGGLLGLIAGITGVNKTTGGQTVELPKGAEPSPDAIKLSESDNNVKWYIPEKPVHPFWDALLNRGEITNTAEQQNRAIQMALAGIPLSAEQQRAIQRGRTTGELEGEFGEGNVKNVQNLKTKTAETQSKVYNAQARNIIEQLDSLYPYINMLTKGGAEAEMAINKLKELQANTGIDLTPLLKAKDESQAQALIEDYKNAILKSQTERGSIPDIINKQNEVLLKNLENAGTEAGIKGMKLAPEYNFYSTPEAQEGIYNTLSSQQELINQQLQRDIDDLNIKKRISDMVSGGIDKLSNPVRDAIIRTQLGVPLSLIDMNKPYYDVNTGNAYIPTWGVPNQINFKNPTATYGDLFKDTGTPYVVLQLGNKGNIGNAGSNQNNNKPNLMNKPAGKPLSINPYPNPFNPYLVR